jgi:carbamoyl-phosphate synthase large subunit
MNLLFSCIGQRGYIADFFRPHLTNQDRILGSGNSRWTPGFTRCDAAFLLPDITDKDYIPSVLKLCEKEGIDAILSFNDQDVVRLANAEDEFKDRGVILLIPSAEVAEIAFDKYRTFEFLNANGIPTPRTALTPEDTTGFHFPLYIKPRRGSGSLDTFVARNDREMRAFYEYRPDMIIQEAVVGEPFNIELCSDFDGFPVGISTWKKYRSRLGETEQAETFRDPTVIDFALSLGESLRAKGPMDIDVFRQGSSNIVLEINTRFGGGYPVSHLAGADFPKLLVDLVRFGKSETNYTFSSGIVMMKRLEIIGGKESDFFATNLRLK